MQWTNDDQRGSDGTRAKAVDLICGRTHVTALALKAGCEQWHRARHQESPNAVPEPEARRPPTRPGHARPMTPRPCPTSLGQDRMIRERQPEDQTFLRRGERVRRAPLRN